MAEQFSKYALVRYWRINSSARERVLGGARVRRVCGLIPRRLTSFCPLSGCCVSAPPKKFEWRFSPCASPPFAGCPTRGFFFFFFFGDATFLGARPHQFSKKLNELGPCHLFGRKKKVFEYGGINALLKWICI